MIMDGCQGKPRTPTIEDRICPNCGNPIEIFSTDTEVACDKCGFVVYNDKLSCVQWCKYAKQCVGEETYEKLMIIARRNQEKADAERRIAEETSRNEGKPEAALPKIVEGRLTGFFKESVLLDQAFAKDQKKSVGQVVTETGGAVTGFARFRVGA